MLKLSWSQSWHRGASMPEHKSCSFLVEPKVLTENDVSTRFYSGNVHVNFSPIAWTNNSVYSPVWRIYFMFSASIRGINSNRMWMSLLTSEKCLQNCSLDRWIDQGLFNVDGKLRVRHDCGIPLKDKIIRNLNLSTIRLKTTALLVKLVRGGYHLCRPWQWQESSWMMAPIATGVPGWA